MRTGTVSYKLEDLKKGVIIPIGFVGENDFTRVIFDAEEIYKKFPNASVSMKVQPPKGVIYPATVTRDGNTVIWQVKEADVANRGGGELQLTFTDGETKIKTYIARTDVKRSLAGNGPAPDPVQDWVDNAEEVLDDLAAMDNIAKTALEGDIGKALSPKTVENGVVTEWQFVEPGAGTDDYADLDNKPSIAGVTLSGNKTLEDLGIASDDDLDNLADEVSDVKTAIHGVENAIKHTEKEIIAKASTWHSASTDKLKVDIPNGTEFTIKTSANGTTNTDIIVFAFYDDDTDNYIYSGPAKRGKDIIAQGNIIALGVYWSDQFVSANTIVTLEVFINGNIYQILDEDEAKTTGITDALAADENELYVMKSIGSWSTSNMRLNRTDGYAHSDENYNIRSYSVTPGDQLKIISRDRFQFQNGGGGSTSTNQRVGNMTYGAGTYLLTVPSGVTHVVASYLKSESAPIVYKKASNAIDQRIGTIELMDNVYDHFELGNITIGNSGWSYTNSTTRVRLKQGETITLRKGDVIKLKDYSNARYYVGWRKADGTYGYAGWLTDDYSVEYDGEYVILLCNLTDTAQTDATALTSILVINAVVFKRIIDFDDDIKRQRYLINENIKSINHRGYNTIAPENTLPAYKLSREYGFKYVETDVSFTSDGVPVLLHDSTINRTARNSDGTSISQTININDITYEQALNYDFGIWKGSAYAETKIPKLKEFLTLCRNIGLHPYIELKSTADYTEVQIQGLVDLVKECGMDGNVTWISYSDTFLQYVKNYDSKARIGFVCGHITSDTITKASALKTTSNYVFIDADYTSNSSTDIDLAIDAGLPVEVWDLSTVSQLLSMNDYITGVTANTIHAGYELFKASM